MRTKPAAASLAAFILAISISFSPAVAQDTYPSRPVRIILTLPAGSAPDVRLRVIGNQLTTIWGRQVVIENRPGGAGTLGIQALLAGPADGHTLLATVGSVFTVLPVQSNKVTFDVNRDLIPVALTSNEGMVFAVSPKLGVNNLAEFIALAKADPEKLALGTNPWGSLPHLAARLFVKLAGAPVTVVPYSTGGTNEAIREILGGRIHGVIEGRPGLKAHLDTGDLKALAIMTRERVTVLPELPSAAETVPDLVAVGWVGIFAPKGLPNPIVQRLAASIRQAMEAPEVRAKLEQTGTPYQPLFTDDFARFIEAEQKLWWPVVKETGPN
jgi:tripartite-type tricarboxylate transporter receptor subunit TctC